MLIEFLFALIEEITKYGIVRAFCYSRFRKLSYLIFFTIELAFKYYGLLGFYSSLKLSETASVVTSIGVGIGTSILHFYTSILYAKSSVPLGAIVFCSLVHFVFNLISPHISDLPYQWQVLLCFCLSSSCGIVILLFYYFEKKISNYRQLDGKM